MDNRKRSRSTLSEDSSDDERTTQRPRLGDAASTPDSPNTNTYGGMTGYNPSYGVSSGGDYYSSLNTSPESNSNRPSYSHSSSSMGGRGSGYSVYKSGHHQNYNKASSANKYFPDTLSNSERSQSREVKTQREATNGNSNAGSSSIKGYSSVAFNLMVRITKLT